MGIKYNAALLIVPIYFSVFIISLYSSKSNLLKTSRQLFLSIALLLILFSPWAVKNIINFNTPLYPYFTFKTTPATGAAQFKKNREKEISFLRHSLPENKYNPLMFVKTIWNKSLGIGNQKFSMINFGMLPLLILPFCLFFIKNKKVLLLFFMGSIYLSLWYVLNGSRTWYAFFGIMISASLIPFILYRKKILLFFTLLFSITICLVNITIVPGNFEYLAGLIDQETFKKNAIIYYNDVEKINNLNLSKNNKLLIVGDFQTAFIQNNDENIIADPYLFKIGFFLNTYKDEALNKLKEENINYIIYSKKMDSYHGWLNEKLISLNNYLLQYQGDAPSIYEDIKTLRTSISSHATLVHKGYYTIYKL